MKKVLVLSMAAVLAAGLCACGGAANNQSETTQEQAGETAGAAEETDAESTEEGATEAELLSGLHHVEIEVENYGTISVELDADVAPITVTNFMDLAEAGFYDGLTFHRIIDGFMIQGGDPNGNGTGGADHDIKGEFRNNGVENDIPHVRGTISMARSQNPDSASSQFFIVQADSNFLDGDYAGFGTVTEGMEIVDAICVDTPVVDNNGTVQTGDQPVITTITVID